MFSEQSTAPYVFIIQFTEGVTVKAYNRTYYRKAHQRKHD